MNEPKSGGRRSTIKKIAILTSAPLERNPRVVKEARTLAGAGFGVTVCSSSQVADFGSDTDLAQQGHFRFVSAVRGIPSLNRRIGRIRRRLGRGLSRTLGLETSWQLGGHHSDLWRCAVNEKADYYIVHLEEALLAGAKLLRSEYRVGIDLEDWYSEDLLPRDRKYRPIRTLRGLEKLLVSRGAHRTCPSMAMSQAIAANYQCELPTVVYNAFPWSDRDKLDGEVKDRKDRSIPSIHWYSQTLGRGRGLEALLAALPMLAQNVEIHLRGKPARGYRAWIDSITPEAWRSRIFVHDLVSNEELLSRIAEHDIGFAGEEKYCLSRDLTVTNKILHYLLAGLAVVASDTAGQQEVAAKAGGSTQIYKSGDANDLATRLNFLLGNKDALVKAKEKALAAARETFCWEKQAPHLLQSIGRALEGKDH